MHIRRVIAWNSPIVALAALAWAARSVDWSDAWTRVHTLSTLGITLILAFPASYYAVAALRLGVILKYLGSPVRFRTLAELAVASFAASYILPSLDIAGKSVKFGILKMRERVETEKIVAGLSVEAIVGSGTDIAARLAVFFILGLAAFLHETIFKIALGVAAVSALIFILPLLPLGIVRKLIRRNRIFNAYEAVRREYLRLWTNPKELLAVAGISLASFGLGFLELKIAAELLGIPLAARTLFLVFTAFHSAWLIPTAGGIGTVEGALVGIFLVLGENPVGALAIAITFRLKEFFWVILGLVFLAKNGISILKINGNAS